MEYSFKTIEKYQKDHSRAS